jgi:hypothetical protein
VVAAVVDRRPPARSARTEALRPAGALRRRRPVPQLVDDLHSITMHRRLLHGATFGGLVGLALLAIGAARYALAARAGAPPTTPAARDVGLGVGYVLAVAVGGAVVGWRDLYRPEKEGAGRLPEPRQRTVRPPGSRPPGT